MAESINDILTNAKNRIHKVLHKNKHLFKEKIVEFTHKAISETDLLLFFIEEIKRYELEISQFLHLYVKQGQYSNYSKLIDDNIEKSAIIETLIDVLEEKKTETNNEVMQGDNTILIQSAFEKF